MKVTVRRIKDKAGNTVNGFDPVNYPEHYGARGGIECIDAMLQTQGKEVTLDFCLGNAFKYLWRHKKKNKDEDIKKAVWYLNKYIEIEERGC